MTDQPSLYSSRITQTYLEFLRRHYPQVDVQEILEYAGMADYEVQDPAQWFSQEQVDRFQEVLVAKTGNPGIAREAGRFTASSEGLGPARQHFLAFMTPMSVYLLMGKLYPVLSRGARVKAKKLGSDRVMISAIPKPDVREKPYQCENRMGIFESLAKFFTGSFATIEHPECIHRGGDRCRYIVSWKKTPATTLKLLRNYSFAIGLPLLIILFFAVSTTVWLFCAFPIVCAFMLFSLFSTNTEKKELIQTVKKQGDVAKDLLDEMKIRHDNALLIQEIGQVTATILDVDRLIHTLMEKMEMHMDFDRGMIMLADEEKTHLVYMAGYGYDKAEESIIAQTRFHLDKPESRGVFVVAFKEQRPFLLNDPKEIESTLSDRSLKFARQMGAHALICVPILYEKESLGILTVDNLISKRPLTKSDMNFLRGIASQTAVSIINARSFHQIQESEKKYRDLVESANSIIMRQDMDGRIIFFNEFAQKFFGFSEAEIAGRNIAGTIMPDTHASRLELTNLLEALKKDPDRTGVVESRNILKSGDTAWVAWTYKPIFNSDGSLKEILCIGNDISELKRSEQDKRKLESHLQRARKMESIGTLAGGVAHDLNNILSGIVSYPELLLMDIPEDSPLRKPILTIQKSGEKAAAIVQDLLTLARRGVSVTEVVNLNAIITEYLRSPEHEKLLLNHPGVQIETRLEGNLLNILGSPVHLSKTIMNLVYNAAEASPDGGNIIITTQNRYVDRLLHGYESVKEGDYVILSVKDSGIGISPRDLERIFEPFYSKKVMGKSGTGLGTAVIWGTVKDHRGYIDVKSTERRGATFTLYFPATRRRAAALPVLTEIREYSGRGESILVIDDVTEQRDIAVEMLTKLDYNVTSLGSGEEAVEYLRTNTVDLLILDMIMEPGMDGLETYTKIIAGHPGQKAVIVSGFSESDRVKKMQGLGAGPYVKKPYHLETIGRVIRGELDR